MECASDELHQFAGVSEGNAVLVCRGGASSDGGVKDRFEARLPAVSKGIDEGETSAVGVYGVSADLSGADLVGALQNEQTIAENVPQFADLCRSEQYGKSRWPTTYKNRRIAPQ
jgi:hypothetical protein